MRVFIERRNKEITLEFEGKLSDLLNKLKINPEEVIVSREGALLVEDDLLENNSSIKILSVISGG